MGHLLTDSGEDYLIQNGLDGSAESWSVGLYNDGTDSVVDSDDVGDLTTEPGGSNYNQQTDSFTPYDEDGDTSGLNDATSNDSQLSFTTDDSTQTVDSWFLVINYDQGGGAADHLIATGSLSQSYDLSSVDQLDIDAGGVGVQVD